MNLLLAGITGPEHLVRSCLKQVRHQPDAITGCPTATGLDLQPP
ncbi:hypothetical protein ACJ6WD_40305 [Streptomyces sp. VTCC 41912]|nr:hypothetical protein [Streptomyces noursei]